MVWCKRNKKKMVSKWLNQKENPTLKTEVEETKLTIRYLFNFHPWWQSGSKVRTSSLFVRAVIVILLFKLFPIGRCRPVEEKSKSRQ